MLSKVRTLWLQSPIDLRFFLLLIPIAYFSYLFHEFGHWAVGEILGNPMLYSLNAVSAQESSYLHPGDELLVSLGGPAFSILQAGLALWPIEKFQMLYAYPFAFFPMFNRFFSDILGGFARQDEARIALLLGTETYLVAVAVLGVLLLIVARCSHTLNVGAKTNGSLVVASTGCQLLVIGSYQIFRL